MREQNRRPSRPVPEKYEGTDIMDLIQRIAEGDDDLSDCNELTRGRIRTIYVQLRYGNEDPRQIAEYYGIPAELVRDIGRGKIFGEITGAGGN